MSNCAATPCQISATSGSIQVALRHRADENGDCGGASEDADHLSQPLTPCYGPFEREYTAMSAIQTMFIEPTITMNANSSQQHPTQKTLN